MEELQSPAVWDHLLHTSTAQHDSTIDRSCAEFVSVVNAVLEGPA